MRPEAENAQGGACCGTNVQIVHGRDVGLKASGTAR
jgi:hypothetical protein